MPRLCIYEEVDTGAVGDEDVCDVRWRPGPMSVPELRDWRQQITGCICIRVFYDLGDGKPSQDCDVRRCASSLNKHGVARRFVAKLRFQGVAEKAGVHVGDELLAITMGNDRISLEGAHVFHNLQAPCALIFSSFHGRFPAEVRMGSAVERSARWAGLRSWSDVAGTSEDAAIEICEAVVFRPAASVMLAFEQDDQLFFHELRRCDARTVVTSAVDDMGQLYDGGSGFASI